MVHSAPHEPHTQGPKGESKEDIRDVVWDVAAALAMENKKSAHEKKNAKEKFYYTKDIGIFWLTVLMFIAAFGSAYFSRLSVLEAERAILSQQRPWLKINDIIPVGNDYGLKRLPISFMANISNVGNIPATNVFASEYKFYPLFKKIDDDVIAKHVRELVKKECVGDIATKGAWDNRTGSILFHNDARTIKVHGGLVSGPEQFLFYIDESTMQDGVKTAQVENFIVYEGVVIFHVSYQSSIDERVHCTAESYRLRGSQRMPILTMVDMLMGGLICESSTQSLEILKTDMSGGYAD